MSMEIKIPYIIDSSIVFARYRGYKMIEVSMKMLGEDPILTINSLEHKGYKTEWCGEVLKSNIKITW